MDKKKSFIIEGNAGAGKSTFLKLVKNKFPIDIVLEPVEQWQNIQGHNILDLFYKDTNRWSYTFQTYAFVTRIKAQEEDFKKNNNGLQLLERSVWADRFCFAKLAFENGKMTALEWKLYQEWFSWLVDNYATKPDGFIYLQTDPSVCYSRLKKRNRHEETGVSLAYLEQIHSKHEQWLIKKEGIDHYLKDVPVLVVQCDADFEYNSAQQQKHFDAIYDFMNVSSLYAVDKKVISTVSL